MPRWFQRPDRRERAARPRPPRRACACRPRPVPGLSTRENVLRHTRPVVREFGGEAARHVDKRHVGASSPRVPAGVDERPPDDPARSDFSRAALALSGRFGPRPTATLKPPRVGTDNMATRTPSNRPAGNTAPEWQLRRYVARQTPRSAKTIHNLRAICERHLEGRCAIEVIDLKATPALAADHQILALPTLIRMLAESIRTAIGKSDACRPTLPLRSRARYKVAGPGCSPHGMLGSADCPCNCFASRRDAAHPPPRHD